MEIVSAAEMRQIEETAINSFGIPAEVLMEHAALALYEQCCKAIPARSRVLILAGRGNNGGDGMALARLLHCGGYDPHVYIPASKKSLSKLAYKQRYMIKQLGIPITEMTPKRPLPSMDGFAAIVDALIGYGLDRTVDDNIARIINAANKASGFKLAVDIPSGLDASTQNIIGETFLADMTVTFHRGKIAHWFQPSKTFCGDVVVADIGIPEQCMPGNQAGDLPGSHPLHLLTEDILPPMPSRNAVGHKGKYGHAVIIGGSAGKSGAAIMASRAALRSGAGLVTCIMPAGCKSAVMNYPELMAFFGHSEDYFTPADAAAVVDFCKDKSALAIGPGLGRHPETFQFVMDVLTHVSLPVVIDADALIGEDALLEAVSGRAVLTPHIGEFARMFGLDKGMIESARLQLSRNWAMNHNVYLMLKSSEIIITAPNGVQNISLWGTPALAKGGSGDILTGIIASLLAQSYKFSDACALGAYMQGKASELATRHYEEYAVIPTDIIDCIGREK